MNVENKVPVNLQNIAQHKMPWVFIFAIILIILLVFLILNQITENIYLVLSSLKIAQTMHLFNLPKKVSKTVKRNAKSIHIMTRQRITTTSNLIKYIGFIIHKVIATKFAWRIILKIGDTLNVINQKINILVMNHIYNVKG